MLSWIQVVMLGQRSYLMERVDRGHLSAHSQKERVGGKEDEDARLKSYNGSIWHSKKFQHHRQHQQQYLNCT